MIEASSISFVPDPPLHRSRLGDARDDVLAHPHQHHNMGDRR